MAKNKLENIISLEEHKRKKEIYNQDESYIDEVVEQVVKEQEEHIDELIKKILTKNKKR